MVKGNDVRSGAIAVGVVLGGLLQNSGIFMLGYRLKTVSNLVDSLRQAM